jgi:hypothetical protein
MHPVQGREVPARTKRFMKSATADFITQLPDRFHVKIDDFVNAHDTEILSPPRMKMFQHCVIPRLDRGIQAKSKTGKLDSGFHRNDTTNILTQYEPPHAFSR